MTPPVSLDAMLPHGRQLGQVAAGPPPAMHPLTQMLWGASFPWRALGFIHRHGLWPWASCAVVVHFVLLLALGIGLWWWTVPWLQAGSARLSAMAADGQAVQAAVSILVWALWLTIVPVIAVASAAIVLLLGQLVASPFLDLLSERAECLVMGHAPTPFGLRRTVAAVFLALADCVWGIVYLGAAYVPLLILSFVPGVGAAVSLIGGALMLAQQFIGLLLSRHLVSYRARWACVLDNRWAAVGFGAMLTAMLAMPGVNLLLLPLAAVGGTLLACALWQQDRLAPALWAPPTATAQALDQEGAGLASPCPLLGPSADGE